MNTDSKLQRAVLEELRWEPSVNGAHIGVSVEGGIVTLTGHVSSYVEKYAAERAARRVHGVGGIANEIDVKLPDSSKRTDQDNALAAAAALASTTQVPAERIKITVENGWVRLEGEVEWQYQKEAAESAVRALPGVIGVSNRVRVKPAVNPTDLKSRIVGALRRTAETESRRIKVEVEGGKVRLRAKVRSWAERQEAERIAWSAPGVSEVENLIVVARPKPAWLRVGAFAALVSVLCGLVAFPLLLFFNMMGWLPVPNPYRPVTSPWVPADWPKDVRIHAPPDQGTDR